MTYPLTLTVESSCVIYIEIIADRKLARVGAYGPHATGKIKVASGPTGTPQGFYESEIQLFPYMSVVLAALGFDLASGNQSGLHGEWRSPLPESAFWTWTITAKTPGTHMVVVKVSGADMLPEENSGVTIHDLSSVEQSIAVLERPLMERLSAGPEWLTTSGPVALLLLLFQGVVSATKAIVDMIRLPDSKRLGSVTKRRR